MDALDAALVRALRANGRAQQQELSVAVGTSRTTVAARLTQLLSSGTVRVVGVVHPAARGQQALAHLTFDVDGEVSQLADAVAADPEVAFVSVTAGRTALVAEARVGNARRLAAVVARLRSLPGARGITTLTYDRLVLDAIGPSVALVGPVVLDDADDRLLKLLQIDGRMSYTALAEQARLSVSAARLRVKRLLADGIVRVGPLLAPGVEQEQAVGVGVRLRDSGDDVVASLVRMPGTRFVATATGRYDVLATVHAGSLGALVPILDDVRRLPGVIDVETWVHLKVVKERYDLADQPGARDAP
ncbi:MAG: hypothetical protein QOI42_1314 [Frankiaceae bacterium]|jgi:DNA-binding Lrp family transcriptional regulator|nr:hypothetical protein [Frankiaceae bacterium]